MFSEPEFIKHALAPPKLAPQELAQQELAAGIPGLIPMIGAAKEAEDLFSPADIPGLVLWLDASDAATIHEDDAAGRVSQWDDKSGNGNDFSQATAAKQPSYSGTTVGFDTSGYRLDGSASFGGATFTIFGVGVPLGTSTARPFCIDTSGTTILVQESGSRELISLEGTSRQSTLNFHGTNTEVFAVGNGANLKHYLNGAIGATLSVITNTLIDQIGGHPSVPGNIFGDIREVVAYNSVLSNADMNLVGNYLSDKWSATAWSDL